MSERSRSQGVLEGRPPLVPSPPVELSLDKLSEQQTAEIAAGLREFLQANPEAQADLPVGTAAVAQRLIGSEEIGTRLGMGMTRVPQEALGEIIGYLPPGDRRRLASANELFQRLIGREDVPTVRAVYTQRQLDMALEDSSIPHEGGIVLMPDRGTHFRLIRSSANSCPVEVQNTETRVVLGDGGVLQVRGSVHRAGISRGKLIARDQSRVSDVTGGEVDALDHSRVIGVSGGKINVYHQSTVTGMNGGEVNVHHRSIVTGISGGRIVVHDDIHDGCHIRLSGKSAVVSQDRKSILLNGQQAVVAAAGGELPHQLRIFIEGREEPMWPLPG